MSTLIVEVAKIDKIEKHPNADRLDLATVKGWQCVVQKDALKVGDKVVYIPIDSILPSELEVILFPPDAKIKLHHSRIKTIRIRKAISQGLLVTPEEVGLSNDLKIGTDVKDTLKITKYEPPMRMPGSPGSRELHRGKKQINPNFHKYTNIENFKNYPHVFEEGELVSVTEKIHGTNFRAGYVKYDARNLWRKFLKFIMIAPKYEFVFGSHNVQLQNRFTKKYYYDKNVYAEAVKKYNLRKVLRPDEVVYGEIYGSGIQKNYSYGCEEGERKLALFDIKKDGEYLDPPVFSLLSKSLGLPTVKEIYKGPFNLESIKELCKGNSKMVPEQRVIEGVVIKPIQEQPSFMGRKVLKFINDEYLLKDNTEFH